MENLIFFLDTARVSSIDLEAARLYFESKLGVPNLVFWVLEWLAVDDGASVFSLVSLLTGKTYVLIVRDCGCGD